MTDLPLPAAPAPNTFPIVGIGASAGGLSAFIAFFSGMPAVDDPGMAFVLVQHLAPNHDSLLPELIQRSTRMKVLEVQDGMTVDINCVYVIPPNRDMAFLNGALHLLEPAAAHGHRLPIDYLFKSLAQDQQERAIGIVLSGTGSDGTLGARAIKSGGGMLMAQEIASCEFDGMPRSAIATGMVDYELPPAEMPTQLIAYASQLFGKPPRTVIAALSPSDGALKKVFILLRAQTGHDFSQYKPNTICRRIERRMAVHQVPTLDSYVQYLQQTPPEVEALFRDLLIGVTNFFRDPDAFAALESVVIPKLFEGKASGAVVRAWTTGCSTGEEAYSIAILLQERLEALKQNYRLQVFSTDIDSRAIASARAGVYPSSIAADMTPERLARFFTQEPGGGTYRVHKGIRDMVVFSEHDLIKDPPFSKLDLISCRNLLIYLGADLQKKLVSLFHYALSPSGMLFLGTSETVGEFGDRFTTLDRKAKLYQRKADPQGAQRADLGRFLSPPADKLARSEMAGVGLTQGTKLSLRELTEQALLQQIEKVGVLVNSQGDVLFLHGRSGMYLEPAPGEVGISNVLKMAREGLRHELTTGLQKVVRSKEAVRALGLRVKTNGHYTLVNLSISPLEQGPVAALQTPLYLVTLEQAPCATSPLSPAAQSPSVDRAPIDSRDADAQITELTEELQAKEEYLHAVNEELETSKEEMQSINEELTTVNTELQTKIVDLTRSNNDMNNLLAGTGIGIGTIFVDHSLNIMRFTPTASLIINLILSDVGRPLGHIVSNLVGYSRLMADAKEVLNTLVPKEVDVQTTGGKFFTMRIMPYRTLDNVIEGAVITFVDITEIVRTREALHKANETLRLAVVVRDATDAITVQDLEGRTIAWNPGATRMYGWTEEEALQMNVRERIPPATIQSELARVHQLSQAETIEPYSTQRLTKGGKEIEVSLTSTALVNAQGQMYAIATTERSKNNGTAHNPRSTHGTAS